MVCTFNNMTLKNTRKEKAYQAILIDFANLGVISKTQAEALLGYAVPDFLETPVAKTNKKVTKKTSEEVKDAAEK